MKNDNANLEDALIDGRHAARMAMEELGEDMDCSDYVGDSLRDKGYDFNTIKKAKSIIKKENGWQ